MTKASPERILWLLVGICLIDAMGFGMMVPLIYNYGKQFGLTKTGLGCLTATFSVAQFFATPILGALSDKIGRKLILIICLVGTATGFALFGLAGSLVLLFAARAIDGFTGGDISVAQAVITDITDAKKRPEYFGILGSAFGAGYVIGPAAGGLLSRFGLSVPFFAAAGLSCLAACAAAVFLKESHKTRPQRSKFSYRSLLAILKRPVIGPAILAGFLLTTAQFVMLIGFQTFCTDQLKFSPTQTGIFYAAFGVTGILMQLAVPLINSWIPSRKMVLLISTLICAAAMGFAGISHLFWPFALGIGIYGLFNGLRNPMLNAVIADQARQSEQGEIMGINQSYISIGQAIGPAIAGLAASMTLHLPFYVAAVLILSAIIFQIKLRT